MKLDKSVAIRGNLLRFRGDPFSVPLSESWECIEDGCILIKDGLISSYGPAHKIITELRDGIQLLDYRNHFILPGFVDSHSHYPQVHIIASYGEKLIQWLDRYTFPAEVQLADRKHAREAANIFLTEMIRNGITTVSAYCTTHPHSVDEFFSAAAKLDLRVVAGKMFMDRNAPEELTAITDKQYDDAKHLIDKWHNRGRAVYSLTPRFAPTSTPSELEAISALWREYPDLRLQTHLSETMDEGAWVKKLYPKAKNYLDVYDRFGLVRKGAVFGHAIHLGEEEFARLHKSGAGIAHCPTSNMFLGSGLFRLGKAKEADRQVIVGLGTDIGAGTSFSMLQTMAAAYTVAQLSGSALNPIRAYYLGTVGGAQALGLDDRIGNIDIGKEADLAVIDPYSTELISMRMKSVASVEEALFVQMMLGDDRAIKATIVSGQIAHHVGNLVFCNKIPRAYSVS